MQRCATDFFICTISNYDVKRSQVQFFLQISFFNDVTNDCKNVVFYYVHSNML